MADIHVDDIGTVFQAYLRDGETARNVSTATTKTIKFEDAEGTVTEKTAAFLTDGTDGVITYTTVAGDLSVAGEWKWQGFVVLTDPAGTWHSAEKNFHVQENLS